MKSEISKRNPDTFPKLMVHHDGDLVVLMKTTDGCGTVVYQNKSGWGLGEYYEKWDMKVFTTFSGTVTLEN